jgi:hypothetical protein
MSNGIRIPPIHRTTVPKQTPTSFHLPTLMYNRHQRPRFPKYLAHCTIYTSKPDPEHLCSFYRAFYLKYSVLFIYYIYTITHSYQAPTPIRHPIHTYVRHRSTRFTKYSGHNAHRTIYTSKPDPEHLCSFYRAFYLIYSVLVIYYIYTTTHSYQAPTPIRHPIHTYVRHRSTRFTKYSGHNTIYTTNTVP